MRKTLCTLLCFLLLSVMPGCSKNSQKELEKHSATTITSGFDTPITLLAYTATEDEFNTYYNTMCNLFTQYNQLFDRFNDYPGINNIKTINDNAGIAPVTVDPVLIQMLLEAKEYTELSQGAFDPTAGEAMDIWHQYRESGITANENGDENPPVPTQEELEAARNNDGWNVIEIDSQNNTVYISKAGVLLDVGGIAKGYATELVAEQLEKDGLEHGAINGGGNVRLIGMKPDDSKWSIGIMRPDDTTQYAGIFYLDHPCSLVTSGDYQRYYVSNGVTYSHIMDPETLQPARKYRSVTIVAEDSGMADCLSTALFVLDQDKGEEVLNQYNATHDDQIGAYWIYQEKPDTPETIYDPDSGYYVYASKTIRDSVNLYGASK